MPDILKKIIAQKEKEVALLKQNFNYDDVGFKKTKSLKKALMSPHALIAEIKRASPAKGMLAPITDPVALAKQYQQAGASAISVLTDEMFFHGSIDDLKKVSEALAHTSCVILRKEFIIDTIQIAQAARYGADAVLLIVAAVKDKLDELLDYADLLGLEVLLEVHTEDELEIALDTRAQIIGINNRNLHTLAVDVQTSLDLIEYIPKHIITVSESGIHDIPTAQKLWSAGFNALLIGEALVKASNPSELIINMRKELA